MARPARPARLPDVPTSRLTELAINQTQQVGRLGRRPGDGVRPEHGEEQHVWVNHDHDLLDVTLHEDGQDGHATQASTSSKTQQVATKAHGSQAPPTSPAGNADGSTSETLHTTAKHPWLTTDRGWITASDLRVGEHVVELGGRTATITALAVHPGAADYYNLTVSQLHTYAVGASRAVVHNTNGCTDPEAAMADLRQFGENLKSGAADAEKVKVVARLDVGGDSFYGVNAHGQPKVMVVNNISKTHAEVDAFSQAMNSGAKGGEGVLYVSRPPCGPCSGALRSLTKQLGLSRLTVYHYSEEFGWFEGEINSYEIRL